MNQRLGRMREEMKREISDIIRKMKDPRIGFVTVTDVDLSADMRHARVFVSVYGNEEGREASLEGLRRATGYVRTEVGKRVRLRHTPEIQFRFDPSIERGARVNQLLREVQSESSAFGRDEAGDDER